jgi:hypothetical protein
MTQTILDLEEKNLRDLQAQIREAYHSDKAIKNPSQLSQNMNIELTSEAEKHLNTSPTLKNELNIPETNIIALMILLAYRYPALN